MCSVWHLRRSKSCRSSQGALWPHFAWCRRRHLSGYAGHRSQEITSRGISAPFVIHQRASIKLFSEESSGKHEMFINCAFCDASAGIHQAIQKTCTYFVQIFQGPLYVQQHLKWDASQRKYTHHRSIIAIHAAGSTPGAAALVSANFQMKGQ